jgi:hypothetical protein
LGLSVKQVDSDEYADADWLGYEEEDERDISQDIPSQDEDNDE